MLRGPFPTETTLLIWYVELDEPGLDACPFCGDAADLEIQATRWESYGKHRVVFFVECPRCSARGPGELTPIKAVNAWTDRRKSRRSVRRRP